MYNSQVEAIIQLHESQVKLTYTSNKKVISEVIDRYVEDDKLLVNRLKIMKNESNVLIFIFLSKFPIMQKHWLITKYNKYR